MLSRSRTSTLIGVGLGIVVIIAGLMFAASFTFAEIPTGQISGAQDTAGGPTPTSTPTPAPCDPVPTIVSSPNGSGAQNRLRAVSAVSPSDIWSVGYYQTSGFFQTMAIKWDGTKWTLVASPNGPGEDNYLYGVDKIESNDVWAVGESVENPATSSKALILHWNGASWSTVSSPNVGTFSRLNAVSAVSSNDVWAVGVHYTHLIASEHTLAMHWDGTSWNPASIPNYGVGQNVVADVEAISTNDVWAVGYAYETTLHGFQNMTWHWDGSSWNIVASPNLPSGRDNNLLAVSATSANDVWAVGSVSVESGALGVILRWDGSSWQNVNFPITPPTSGNALRGVYANTANDVWVTGNYGSDHLTARWDGSTWNRIYDSVNDELNDITVVAPNVAWGVGYDSKLTLTVRYDYPCETGTPTPTGTLPTATQTSTEVATSIATATSAVTATPTVCTLQFQDVPDGSTFYPFVRCMACHEIVNGYPCGGDGEPCGATGDPYFRPNNHVTRGQIAKILANASGFTEPVSGQSFQDVPPGSTFYSFVQRLAYREVMSGYPCGGPEEPCGTGNLPYFRPGANATRGQLAKLVSNAAGLQDPVTGQTFEDVDSLYVFYEFIERLVALGAMAGYPCGSPEPCVAPGNRPYFRPSSNVTRGQTSKIVANTFFPGCNPTR